MSRPETSWWSRSQNPARRFFEKGEKAAVNLPLDVALTRGAPESHEAWTLPAEFLECSANRGSFFPETFSSCRLHLVLFGKLCRLDFPLLPLVLLLLSPVSYPPLTLPTQA